MNRSTGLLTFYFTFSILILVFLVAIGIRDAFASVGSALFGAGVVLLIAMKSGLLWLARRQVQQPGLPCAKAWQWLSAGCIASAGLGLAAGILGASRPWSWMLSIAAGSLGWGYFALSRREAGNDWAA